FGHRIESAGQALELGNAALALGARGPVARLPPRRSAHERVNGASDKPMDIGPGSDRQGGKKDPGKRDEAPYRTIDFDERGFAVEPDGDQQAARPADAHRDIAVNSLDAVDAGRQAHAGFGPRLSTADPRAVCGRSPPG